MLDDRGIATGDEYPGLGALGFDLLYIALDLMDDSSEYTYGDRLDGGLSEGSLLLLQILDEREAGGEVIQGLEPCV